MVRYICIGGSLVSELLNVVRCLVAIYFSVVITGLNIISYSCIPVRVQ